MIFRKFKKTKQKFMKNNVELGRKKCAYGARSIEQSGKKNNKGVYGTASKEEIKELKEEGVKTEIIPWFEDKSNQSLINFPI